ncbi:15451_t:CDS:1, partial [Dentiscutata erythropus]
MFFTTYANKKSSNCERYNIIASDLQVTWYPDPVGYVGMAMTFTVNTTLNKPSTFNTKLMFSFNGDDGRIVGFTVHPVEPNIIAIQGDYDVIVPAFIPPSYTVSVSVGETSQ